MTLTPAVSQSIEILAMVTGVGYAVLAAWRNRFCWVAGAVSSAGAALLAGARGLPMQSGLQVFFVFMSVYGWLNWTRSAQQGELPVGRWPTPWHLGAAVAITLLSFASARYLAAETRAAWPLLDSLTTWFSLLATWLAARARLENWLYWVVINALSVFIFFAQKVWGMALLSVLLAVIAVGGFIDWRRRLRLQGAPA